MRSAWLLVEGSNLICSCSLCAALLLAVLPPTLPCRVLLLRLVLLREQILQLLLGDSNPVSGNADAQAGDRQPFAQLQAVPKSCVVFLQRLVASSTSEER